MIDKLRQLVELKLGEKVENVKACQRLSESIKEECGILISDSTIRRLWNMLPGTSKPSAHTLNVVAKYIGYESWVKFCNKVTNEEESKAGARWKIGKQYAERYTLGTVSYLFKRAGVTANNVVQRQFIDDQILALLESDYAAATVIAPGGFGKSLGIASWVSRFYSKRRFSDTIVFFVNGSQIDTQFNQNFTIATWLSNQVFKSTSNVFADPDFFEGKSFFLIIDALDEVDGTIAKSGVFFKKVVDFIGLYSNVKLLVSARTSVWAREMVYEVTGNVSSSQKWMGFVKNSLNNDYTNLPSLNLKEIQDIIDNFINNKRGQKLLVEQLNFTLKEAISHPYMLKLFISIYSPEMLKLQNSNDLIDEFVSREIIKSKYSDEKIDILNLILEMQDYGKKHYPIRKNDIKNKYPINLRKNGNYFAAYEHLLAFGVLSEETVENKFKNMVTQVDFSHSNLRDLLITRYLVEENGGVTFDLFLKINDDYSDSDLRGRLLCSLYSIAYSENNFEALKNFYLIPLISMEPDILNHVMYQLRADKPIQHLLFEVYSKSRHANEYLINNYFDFDSLNTSYYKLLRAILTNSETKNERIYCLSGLALYSAQLVDIDKFKEYSDELLKLSLDDSCGRYCVVVYSLWKIYHIKLVDRTISPEQFLYEIEKNLQYFLNRNELKDEAFFCFYLELIPHLLLFKDIGAVKYIFEVLNAMKDKGASIGDAKILAAYDLYNTIYKITVGDIKDLTAYQSYSLEKQINSLTLSHSYTNRISAYVLLAFSYLLMNDHYKFMYYYRNALEICSNCKLNLTEISMLKNLALLLKNANLEQESNAFKQHSLEVAGGRLSEFYDLV